MHTPNAAAELSVPVIHPHAALFEDGAFLELPPNVAVDAPIALVFLADAAAGPVAAHPRTLVVVGEGARATVEEVYLGEGGAPVTVPVEDRHPATDLDEATDRRPSQSAGTAGDQR